MKLRTTLVGGVLLFAFPHEALCDSENRIA
jgi:hypothetical protein